MAVIVKLENSKTAFRKFGKVEEGSSKFLEIRKFENFQMNDAHMSFLQFNHFPNLTFWGNIKIN